MPDEILIYCGIIIVFNGIFLGLYHYLWDPNKDAERHYFRTCKWQYAMFKLSYLVLLFSFIFSTRYIVFALFSKIKSSI